MLGIGLVTLMIFVGGVFMLSRKETAVVGTSADPAVLVREDSLILPATEEQVQLVEFTDMQCPFCAQAHPVIAQLLANYPEKITFVVRHFPLLQHQHAVLAAEAVEAANAQGRVWEMYDLIYANQTGWEDASSAEARAMFAGFAEELGLNLEQFNQTLDDQTYRTKIQRDSADGSAVGVAGTPTFFVDGAKFSGSLQSLVTMIEDKVKPVE